MKNIEFLVTSCGECPFCNHCNEYGRDACNFPYGDVTPVLDGDIFVQEQLPEYVIHGDCPLRKYDITIKLK